MRIVKQVVRRSELVRELEATTRQRRRKKLNPREVSLDLPSTITCIGDETRPVDHRDHSSLSILSTLLPSTTTLLSALAIRPLLQIYSGLRHADFAFFTDWYSFRKINTPHQVGHEARLDHTTTAEAICHRGREHYQAV